MLIESVIEVLCTVCTPIKSQKKTSCYYNIPSKYYVMERPGGLIYTAMLCSSLTNGTPKFWLESPEIPALFDWPNPFVTGTCQRCLALEAAAAGVYYCYNFLRS